MSGIRIIATEVMLPRGLLGLGIDTVDISGLEIKEALSLYATRESLPILVHCTQGKDRTGSWLTFLQSALLHVVCLCIFV